MPSNVGAVMNNPEILTPLQKRLLSVLFADEWFRRYFYLTGGTALTAFYLHHRYSEDLDFFSHDVELTPIPQLMEAAAKKLAVSVERVQTSPSFMRYLFGGELKVDVVADVGFRVGSPELVGDYMVDTIKNIAVNKVGCLLGRLDAKDYVDLYLILKKYPVGESPLGEAPFDIFELLSLGQKKDAGLEPFVWASLITDVKTLTLLPRMITEVTLSELRDFFLSLRDQILDKIQPEKKRPSKS
ncbi:MAG: nucleotidyl transferase AbiEii/AbiGii toxin family protein [Deltaproteobacteria bacterium]|nr:nucleotidyl transferase AbiEii/AbiGii toxin family protein [Deltaproteobacteria bacterium]